MNLLHPGLAFGGVDGGECTADALKVTWPSDVDDFKARLAPIVQGIDSSVTSCPGMTAADRGSWLASFQAWQAFAAVKTSTFGSANAWQTTCAWAKTFDAWRDKLAGLGCAIAGPNQIQVEQTKPLDLVKYLVAGGVVLGGTVLLLVYAPEIKAAAHAILPSKKSGDRVRSRRSRRSR